MKRIDLRVITIILLCSQLLLTSCQGLIDSIFGSTDNPNSHDNIVINKEEDAMDIEQTSFYSSYQMAFVSAFGVPVANHNWGFSTSTEKTRIMVEDISAESLADIDFNDVVFDVLMTSTGADITIQAIGSTLPIYVGGKEVHELFGVSTSTMVNASGLKDKYLSPITFSLDGDFKNNPINIEVKVYKSGHFYKLTALEGKVPCKIAVSTSCEWCEERLPISKKYSNFISWVSGSSNDINPKESVYSESPLFPDEASIKSALSTIYLDAVTFECYQQVIEAIRMKKIDGASYNINLDNASDETLLNAWTMGYMAVNKANVVINELENSDVSYNKAAFFAEAVALRSFIAYNMTMLWGDIPYVTDVNTDFTPIQTKSADIMDKLIQTLETVKDKFGDNYNASEAKVHFTKGAVQALLSELYLSLDKHSDAKNTITPLTEMDKDIFVMSISTSIGDNPILDAYKAINSSNEQIVYGKLQIDLLAEEANQKYDGLSAQWRKLSTGYGLWSALKRLNDIADFSGLLHNDNYLPIPIQELMLNPNIIQNPGY